MKKSSPFIYLNSSRISSVLLALTSSLNSWTCSSIIACISTSLVALTYCSLSSDTSLMWSVCVCTVWATGTGFCGCRIRLATLLYTVFCLIGLCSFAAIIVPCLSRVCSLLPPYDLGRVSWSAIAGFKLSCLDSMTVFTLGLSFLSVRRLSFRSVTNVVCLRVGLPGLSFTMVICRVGYPLTISTMVVWVLILPSTLFLTPLIRGDWKPFSRIRLASVWLYSTAFWSRRILSSSLIFDSIYSTYFL